MKVLKECEDAIMGIFESRLEISIVAKKYAEVINNAAYANN